MPTENNENTRNNLIEGLNNSSNYNNNELFVALYMSIFAISYIGILFYNGNIVTGIFACTILFLVQALFVFISKILNKRWILAPLFLYIVLSSIAFIYALSNNFNILNCSHLAILIPYLFSIILLFKNMYNFNGIKFYKFYGIVCSIILFVVMLKVAFIWFNIYWHLATKSNIHAIITIINPFTYIYVTLKLLCVPKFYIYMFSAGPSYFLLETMRNLLKTYGKKTDE